MSPPHDPEPEPTAAPHADAAPPRRPEGQGALPVALADVVAAARRVRGVALRTPLLAYGPPGAPAGTDPGGRRTWLKPESLQPIGAFKIRGAYNALAQLDAEQRAVGVVTHSSGNHAQGVSRAARLLGIHAVVVMPHDAPAVKVAGVRADGAEIVLVGSDNVERVARAEALAREQGLVLIPSYDDARIVAGQGTLGLEIVEQLEELGEGDRPLSVLVPIGGGGLAAGVCVAVKGRRPGAVVLGVEPELAADAAASMRQGRIVRWEADRVGRTIADGMRTEALGHLPFAILRRLLDGVLTVSEDGIRRAMAEAAVAARLVVEPSGATTLAAWLDQAERIPSDGDVVIVLSGGNVDPDRYRELVAAGRAATT